MSRAYFARALGRSLLIAATAVLVTVAAQVWDLPGVLNVVGVVVAAVVLMIAAFTAASLLLPPALLRLDADGFRALRGRVAGRNQGGWLEVTSVGTQRSDLGTTLVITLADGGHTAVPLGLTDTPAADVEAAVRERLDQAHGYRRLT